MAAISGCDGLDAAPSDAARIRVQVYPEPEALEPGTELFVSAQVLDANDHAIDNASVYFLRTTAERLEFKGAAESELITRTTKRDSAGGIAADGLANVTVLIKGTAAPGTEALVIGLVAGSGAETASDSVQVVQVDVAAPKHGALTDAGGPR